MRVPAEGVAVKSGEDALLTCVVLGARGKPVLWKRARNLQLLTAGGVRVTRYERVRVLHDDSDEPLKGPGIKKGGDVWVLVIKSVKPSDAGLYMCELNTEPPVRSFHRLTVISRGLTPPESQNATDTYSANVPTLSSLALAHNYTDCCLNANVSAACLGFCSIQTILEGTGQDPEICQPNFPAIVNGMADGRNHVPCCVQEHVPDICQDVCRGEFTPVTDNIKTHYSCATYMEKTLACIVEGIGTLSLSAPILFTTTGQEVGAAAAPVSGGAASAVGGAVACILLTAILLAGALYYRHRKNLRLKSQGGVAFENPSYLRETNPDTIINGTLPNGNANGTNGANGVSNSAAWRQETLQNPSSAREVEPTLYEELKLGQDGAGFKRLKP